MAGPLGHGGMSRGDEEPLIPDIRDHFPKDKGLYGLYLLSPIGSWGQGPKTWSTKALQISVFPFSNTYGG